MAGNGGKRPPLVADRRGAPNRAGPSRGAPPQRQRNRGPRPGRGNAVTRFVGAVVGFVFRLVWGIAWRLGAAVTALVAVATFYFYTTLPPATDLIDGRARGSVTLVDADGQVFAWRGETFGVLPSAMAASEHLRNAVVATEDRRFWWHFGISPRGIAGAIRGNLAAGRSPFSGAGGSTITQQLAKLLCLGRPYDASVWRSEAEYEADCRRSTLWRKLQEVPYAFALEMRYSKEEILTVYMNRAFLGAGARGFEAAAQRYFGRSAAQVDTAQAAMLAGLLVAPSYFAPTRNLTRAQQRASVVLGLMADQGYLTPAELAEARAYPAVLSESADNRTAGWFADWAMQVGPSWLTRDTTEDVVIQTTMDPRIQSAAEDALAQVFANRVREGSVAEAAIVVMSADGAVRGMVGGRRYVQGGFNRATQAQRQTGSAFKPFVYALAMELGYEPWDMVDDAPMTMRIPGSAAWTPRNYTNEFLGMMPIVEAFARSQNIPAVRISEAMGRENVRRVANGFGLSSDLAEGPALALGSSESTLLDMTAAYAGILNGGTAVRPYGFTSIRLAADTEPLMGIGGGMQTRVISEEAAHRMVWMMTQVIEAPFGTGRRAALSGGRQAAGKTGTTQGARDAWFVGFTADYVVGVWMGNDDNAPLTGVTGGGLPAEIWRETMERIHAGTPVRPLPMVVPGPQGFGGRHDGVGPSPGAAVPQGMSGPAPVPSLDETIRGILSGIFGN